MPEHVMSAEETAQFIADVESGKIILQPLIPEFTPNNKQFQEVPIQFIPVAEDSAEKYFT